MPENTAIQKELATGDFGGAWPGDPLMPKPANREEYEALSPGTKYMSPEGDLLTKYHRPKNASEYAALPEGSEYISPEGKKLTKKKTEPLDFTTQTLFNMGVNEKERRKALERGYPGKVRNNPTTGELEIAEDGGKIRRPKGMTEGGFLAGAAGAAAPVTGSVLGAIGGNAPGAVGGALLGQTFNDTVLALTGVMDRSITEQASADVLAGASAVTGYGTGKGIAAIAPAAANIVKKGAAPVLASVFGSTKEGIEQALSLREKGVLVPPSTYAPEAPYLINIGEVFDPAFRTQRPLEQSAVGHFERTSKQILEDAGVKDPQPVTKPTAAVPMRQAGEALQRRAQEQLQELDKRLDAELAARQGEVKSRAAGSLPADPASLRQTAAEARRAAQTIVDQGFADIQRSVDEAVAATKTSRNSGDLWTAVGEKFKAFREAIAERAKIMYDQAGKAAGGHLPDVSGLPDLARDFLEQLPEGFENRYPSIVKQLRDIGGIEELDQAGNPTGNWVKEPANPTFPQLHNLRSFMRANYNRLDLTPDVKEGTFKYFANRVDEVLKDPGAVPELQEAARLLREADTFYRENMGPLTDRRIQAVMDGLSSGLPADPKLLFDAVVKEGRSDVTRKMREMVGPNLWAGIKAADIQEMLDMSKTLVPGVIDGKKFASQVLDRDRRGMLEAVHGREVSERLLNQARSVEELGGRLDLPVRPGDTLSELVSRARLAEEAAVTAAKRDPLAALNKEMKAIEGDIAKKRAVVRRAAEKDILGFLYNPTVGASEAAKRILENEDFTLAAAARFGKDSPEFKMLQQAALERLLRQTRQPSHKLAAISEEVQNVLFPGATREQLHLLAKEMDFLFASKAHGMQSGKSIAAQQRVNHPWGSIPVLKQATKITGMDFVGRQILGKYYKTVLEIMNKPGLMRFVQKGLEGDELSRARIREMLSKMGKTGGVVGAGAGEFQEQRPAKHPSDARKPAAGPTKTIRFDAQGNPIPEQHSALEPGTTRKRDLSNPMGKAGPPDEYELPEPEPQVSGQHLAGDVVPLQMGFDNLRRLRERLIRKRQQHGIGTPEFNSLSDKIDEITPLLFPNRTG